MKHLFVLLILALVSTANIQAQDKYAGTSLTKEGQVAPDFTFKATDGKTYRLSDFKGKVVWLNFFATWCPPCKRELPELEHLSTQFPEVVFLSLARSQDLKTVDAFVKKGKYTYLFGEDPAWEAYGKYATQYIPRNYLINAEGKIEMQTVGFDRNEFKEMALKMGTLLKKEEKKEEQKK